MKPSQIAQAIKTCIKIGRPPFIWGPPGVGKSQVMAQVADELFGENGLIDVRAILLDPVDLRGLPHVNGDGRAHWAQPDFLPREGKGILFLDELNAAPPMTQAACYSLVLDRKIGEYELPDGWIVAAAGNREGDRSNVSRMPAALANRFLHYDFEVDLDDWTKYALANDFKIELVAYLRFQSEMLNVFNPDERAFPTPRSWEFVSQILKSDPPADIEHELIAGAVGEGAAAALVGFLKIYRTLPSPDAILMDPSGADVPTDSATLYALAGSLARRASQDNMDRVVTYADRLPAEFGILLVIDAARRDPAVTHTKAFIKWSANHSDILI